MSKHRSSLTIGIGLFFLAVLGLALIHTNGAQAQSQYPIMDAVAAKVVQKYQNSTCEQLWEKRNSHAPPTMEETRVLTLLHDDANMRAAFIGIVAPPIANKMFDCGMFP